MFWVSMSTNSYLYSSEGFSLILLDNVDRTVQIMVADPDPEVLNTYGSGSGSTTLKKNIGYTFSLLVSLLRVNLWVYFLAGHKSPSICYWPRLSPIVSEHQSTVKNNKTIIKIFIIQHFLRSRTMLDPGTNKPDKLRSTVFFFLFSFFLAVCS